MNNLKKYDEFVNELKSSTWKSASDKASEYGQKHLSDRFKQKHFNTIKFEEEEKERLEKEEKQKNWEKRKSENIELRIMDEFKYDYYLDSYETSEDGNIEWKQVVKMKLQDMDWWSEDEFAFFLDFTTPEGNDLDNVDEHNNIMAFISIEGNRENIIHFNNVKCKFANKISALRFLKTLEKLYVVQDYNRIARSVAKINNTTISEVENGDFRVFIDESFGSWKEFRSKINLRQLYDTY